MKLSALYKRLLRGIPGRPKPPTKEDEKDDKSQDDMEQYQAHLEEIKGTMPDRGPSEFGDMAMYSNLDRAI